MTGLLEVRDVTKSFGAVTAVQRLSFDLQEGEVLGIMGPNGAGKSTLITLIMGVYPLDRGEIRLGGERLQGLNTSAISHRGIGRTFQIPQPFKHMTALEHVLVGELYGRKQQSMSCARTEAFKVLECVGLANRASIPASQFGLLELKRLELARALALRPQVLLLDEIAAGLVETEVAELKQILMDLKHTGQTMVIIEHVLSVLFDLSDRILVMNFGEQLAAGRPEEILRDPRVIEAYLGHKKECKSNGSGKPGRSNSKWLVMDRVCAGYGEFMALSDVSLEIEEGEIVALVGVNGAGKTTLIRALTRQLPITSGDILYRGRSIARTPAHAITQMGIAQSLEGRKIFPEMTLRENLELGAYCPRARAQRHKTLQRVYDLFPPLAQREHQLGSTLSGGEQQMLAIGRALMAMPDLIVFDELSLGLAPLVIEALYQAVIEINRQGMTVLLVEQNVHRSLDTARRAYVIERGRIVLSGTCDELSANRQFRETYFGL
jgi:branched-chain amino acid transport system ATP-binding protein